MGGVIIDGLEGTNIVQKPAKLVASRGKYFLEIGKTRRALPPGGIPEGELEKAAGSDVIVLLAGRVIVAVVPIIIKRRRWPCYVPPPEILRRLHEDVQVEILNRYAAEGVITKAAAERIAGVR